MLFFRGFGFLGLLIPFAFGVISQLTLGETSFNAGIGYIIGGIINFYLGRKLNKKGDPHYKSVNSILKYIDGRHSLFFIRLEYWSFIAFTVAILVMTPNSDGIFDKVLIGFGYLLILISILWFIREGKSISMQVEKYSKEKEAKTKPKERISSKKHLKESNKFSNLNKLKNKSEFIEEMKKKRNTNFEFPKSDHSRYMPKKE